MKKEAFIFIAIGSLGILLSVCSPKEDKNQVAEHFAVKRADLRDVISQIGEVQPIINIEVKSEASGRIKRIPVIEGQWVTKKDTLIVIDPTRLQTQRDKMDIGLKKSILQMNIAQRNYDHNVELMATGSITKNQLEDSKNDLEMRSLDYQQQLLELKEIDMELSKTVIVSPLEGVITNLYVKEGEIAVSATSGFQNGTAIATIADVSHLEVITQVGETDYIKIKPDQKVILRLETQESVSTTGTIRFVSLSAKKRPNEELGLFEVRVAIDSVIAGIAPGINMHSEFMILDKKNVLSVPFQCVSKEDQKMFVNKLVKGNNGKSTSEKVEVHTGLTDFKNYEIIDGVAEGDSVVFNVVISK